MYLVVYEYKRSMLLCPRPRISPLFLLSVNRWLSTSSLFTSHFRQQMALTRRYNIRVFFAMLLEGAARRRPREPSRVKRIIKDFAPRKCTCRTTFLKASSINFTIMVELLIYFIFLFFFKCMFVNARFFFFGLCVVNLFQNLNPWLRHIRLFLSTRILK